RKAAKPTTARELVELASFCGEYRKCYRAAVGFFSDAFAADPKLAADTKAQHRYSAACDAALAAAGKGEDAAGLADKERAHLRRRARDWLRAGLAAYARLTEKADARKEVQKRLNHWLHDPDLASVRDEKALAALPEKERQEWQKLWAEVAALRKKAEGKE